MAKNKRPTIIVDADAIVAQAHPEDENHMKSLKIAEYLNKNDYHIFFPTTAISEAITVLQRKKPKVSNLQEIASYFSDKNTSVLNVDKEIYTNALKYFDSNSSKKNTMFDCIICSLAKEHDTQAIFSFDIFYKKKGLKLASELIG